MFVVCDLSEHYGLMVFFAVCFMYSSVEYLYYERVRPWNLLSLKCVKISVWEKY